jgi:hypothetical protein
MVKRHQHKICMEHVSNGLLVPQMVKPETFTRITSVSEEPAKGSLVLSTEYLVMHWLRVTGPLTTRLGLSIRFQVECKWTERSRSVAC